MPYSVNFKTDVVDYDAGTNISADTVEELKQNITDFVQSGLLDYITHAALRAREAGRAAKNGTPAPTYHPTPQQVSHAEIVSDHQAVQNVQQAFPQAQEFGGPVPGFKGQPDEYGNLPAAGQYQSAPPVPQPSVPAGVEFQEGGPNGDLKLFLPFKQNLDFKALNDALRGAGARGVKKSDDSGFEKWKRVPRDRQADVVRVVSQFFG